MSEVSVLRKHLINYAKTKDVFAAYKASGYNREFYEAHRDMLVLRSAAKRHLMPIRKRTVLTKAPAHQRAEHRVCDTSGTKEKLLCRVSQDQIGNAGLACGTEDCAGNPERGRTEERAAA